MDRELYKSFIKLIRAGKRTSTAFDRQLRDRKATLTQGEVLFSLEESGPTRSVDVADRICVNKASIVPMVERLEREGLVRRSKNKEDDRSYLVSLTDSGQKKVSQLREAMNEIAQEMIQGVSATEAGSFDRCLDKILKNIDGGQS